MVSFLIIAGLAVMLFVIFNRQISSAFGSSAEGITDAFGSAGKGITDFFDKITDPLDLDGSRSDRPYIRSDIPLAFADDVDQRNALTPEEASGATSIRQDETGAVFIDDVQVRDSLPDRIFLDDVGEFFENAFNIPQAFGETGEVIPKNEVDTPKVIETDDELESVIAESESIPQSVRQNRNQSIGTPAQSEINNQQFQVFGSDPDIIGVVRESQFDEPTLRSRRQESDEIRNARQLADESRQRDVADLDERQRQSRDSELQQRADRANRNSLGSNFGLTPEEIALRLTGGNISNF